MRCRASTWSATRCARAAAVPYGYCWQHARRRRGAFARVPSPWIPSGWLATYPSLAAREIALDAARLALLVIESEGVIYEHPDAEVLW